MDIEKFLERFGSAFDAQFAEVFDDDFQAAVDKARAKKGFPPKEQPMLSGKPEAVIDEYVATRVVRTGKEGL